MRNLLYRALRQSHVNGATTLKLYGYIGTWKCQNLSARGRLGGGAGPLNVNLGPPIISETTGARKLKLPFSELSLVGLALDMVD